MVIKELKGTPPAAQSGVDEANKQEDERKRERLEAIDRLDAIRLVRKGLVAGLRYFGETEQRIDREALALTMGKNVDLGLLPLADPRKIDEFAQAFYFLDELELELVKF